MQVNREPFKEIVKVKTWTKINQQNSFLEEQRKIKVKTWTKINQQNIFLEGHFKTIGKWVQKRQTLIFTVAKIFIVVFIVYFELLG